MVLQRRDKRRYILVYINDQIIPNSLDSMNVLDDSFKDIMSQIIFEGKNSSSREYKNNNTTLPKNNIEYNDFSIFSKMLKKRFSELFGSIECEKANIVIIFKQNFSFRNCLIIRCNLQSVDKVLFTISCCNPPLTTIKISGTLKKLSKSIVI
jgi:RNase P/RNase MRP subunit POP5